MISVVDELVNALKAQHVESTESGESDDAIVQIAKEHAEWMAANNNLTHDGFEDRQAKAISEVSDVRNFAEVVAMNGEETAQDAAASMVQQWLHSRPHRLIINGHHDLYGYAMAQNDSGKWYACGFLCDALPG